MLRGASQPQFGKHVSEVQHGRREQALDREAAGWPTVQGSAPKVPTCLVSVCLGQACLSSQHPGPPPRLQDPGQYLGDPVMLQLYDPGDSHLHAAEHRDDLQDLVVERRGCEGLQGPMSKLTSAPGLNTPPRTAASLRRLLH